MRLKGLARLLLWPFAFMLLVGAGWLLAPVFVSTDLVTSAIEREIASVSGRRVTLGSPTEVSLFPSPSARLNDVIIREQSSASTQPDPLGSIEAVELEMTFASILTGRPQFSRIHLVNPVVRLRASDDGIPVSSLPLSNVNQAVRIAQRQRADERTNSGDSAASAGTRPPLVFPDWLSMRVGTITFSNGTVLAHANNADAASPMIEQASGAINWPRLDSAFAMDITFMHRGERIDLKVGSASPVDALAGEITPVQLQLQSGIATGQFDGQAGFSAGFYAVGDLTFETPSLRRLLLWRGETMRPALALERIALTSSLTTRGQTVRLDDLTIDIDGNQGSGIVELSDGRQAPLTIIGTLDFATLDLHGFLSAFVALPSSINSGLAIDTRFMDQIQTDFRISATEARFGPVLASNVAATAQTTGEIALFDIGDATAFGGSLQARLRFDRVDNAPRSEFAFSGQEIDFAALNDVLDIASVLPVASGDFSVVLSSPLSSWRNLFKQADGSARLRLGSGLLPGFDPETIGQLNQRSGFVAVDLDASIAPFSGLDWEGEITNGEVSLSALTARYDAGALRFGGLVQLAGKSLAASVTAVDDQDESTGPTHFIGGGLNAPYILPSLTSPRPDRPQ